MSWSTNKYLQSAYNKNCIVKTCLNNCCNTIGYCPQNYDFEPLNICKYYLTDPLPDSGIVSGTIIILTVVLFIIICCIRRKKIKQDVLQLRKKQQLRSKNMAFIFSKQQDQEIINPKNQLKQPSIMMNESIGQNRNQNNNSLQ